ncbi:MAG: serine hydrolase domain-containing protein [Promethearchaeota archaeon]
MTKNNWKVIVILILAFIVPFTLLSMFFYQPIYAPVFLSDASSVDDFISQLNDRISGLLETHMVPGAAIAVISNNQTEYIYAGLLDYRFGSPITLTSQFQLGSISKSQCAFAIMKLVQDGLIDLDEPIQTYLTRWILLHGSFNASKVTVRRILSHTAGFNVPTVTMYQSLTTTPRIEDALILEGVRVVVEPGTEFIYSGGGFGVLQLLIEEVTGMRYAEYLTTQIFQPLGLNNSQTYFKDTNPNQLAIGHGYLREVTPSAHMALVAAAGHYSSIEDMASWCNALLADDTFLNASITETMFSPEVGNSTYGYALGFHCYELNNGLKVVGHDGSIWGYNGVFRIIRETGDGIVILTNGDRGRALITEIMIQWEKLMGDGRAVVNDEFTGPSETQWEIEYVHHLWLTQIELLISLVIIVFLGVGIIRGNIVIDLIGVSKLGLRVYAAVVLLVVLVVYLINWWWADMSFSHTPSSHVLAMVIPASWLVWAIPASLVIRYYQRINAKEGYANLSNRNTND